MEGLPGQYLFSVVVIVVVGITTIIIIITIMSIIITIIICIMHLHYANGQLAQHSLHHPLQRAPHTLWLHVTAVCVSTTHV